MIKSRFISEFSAMITIAHLKRWKIKLKTRLIHGRYNPYPNFGSRRSTSQKRLHLMAPRHSVVEVLLLNHAILCLRERNHQQNPRLLWA
jgi:hypothetical protein